MRLAILLLALEAGCLIPMPGVYDSISVASPDGRYVAAAKSEVWTNPGYFEPSTASRKLQIELRDLRGTTLSHWSWPGEPSVSQMAWSPDDSRFAACGASGLRVYELNTPSILEGPDSVSHFCWKDASTLVCVQNKSGGISVISWPLSGAQTKIWGPGRGGELGALQNGLAPDGGALAYFDKPQIVCVDLQNTNFIRTLDIKGSLLGSSWNPASDECLLTVLGERRGGGGPHPSDPSAMESYLWEKASGRFINLAELSPEWTALHLHSKLGVRWPVWSANGKYFLGAALDSAGKTGRSVHFICQLKPARIISIDTALGGIFNDAGFAPRGNRFAVARSRRNASSDFVSDVYLCSFSEDSSGNLSFSPPRLVMEGIESWVWSSDGSQMFDTSHGRFRAVPLGPDGD